MIQYHNICLYIFLFLFLSIKAFEDGMKQKQEQLQKLREKLLNLIKTHPNSPEVAKWEQMLAEIGSLHH